jgi:hypothetical protein
MSGEMTRKDLRKFDDGTLPPLDYGYDGIPIHIPGLDTNSYQAYDDLLDS